MNQATVPRSESVSVNDWQLYCMCGKHHPCPDHGQWAHPCDEQLALLEVRR